jgi:hypothetical protein
MAVPSRTQIEAIVTQPTYTVEYWDGAAWTAIGDQYVANVTADFTADDGGAQPLGFSASVGVSGSLTLTSDAPAFTWERTPIRARFGFETSDQVTGLYGVITDRRDSPEAIAFALAGLDLYISGQTHYSPMIAGRPAATATSATSVEDPADGVYAAGIVNWILWQCGGRPIEQVADYPDAAYYYTCQTAIMGPAYAWIAGDDPWQELGRLCASCGGQLYQRPDGVVAYVNPLTLGGTAAYTLDVETCESETRTDDLIRQYTVTYTTRAPQPFGLVYSDTTPRLIKDGDTLTFSVSPDAPVVSWYTTDGSHVHADHILIVDYTGQPVIGLAPVFTEQAGGRATISVENTSGGHVVVTRLTLYGVALAVVAEGTHVTGSGTPQATNDAVNVQDRTHARRIGAMVMDFYATTRARRHVTGIGYDPDRVVGEVVTLTCDQPSISGAHRMNTIAPGDTGATMDVDLVDVSDIPVLTDFFLVDTAYADATTRKWGY